MKLLSVLLALMLVLSGPASFAESSPSCDEILKTCDEMAKSYETAIAEQRLAIQAQDGVVKNLREQRDLALKSRGGSFLTDWVVPFLVGGAAATLIIGIRR